MVGRAHVFMELDAHCLQLCSLPPFAQCEFLNSNVVACRLCGGLGLMHKE